MKIFFPRPVIYESDLIFVIKTPIVRRSIFVVSLSYVNISSPISN